MTALGAAVGLFLLGLAIGVGSSMLGVGGGILVVPLLPWFVDLPMKSVVATSLATVAVLSAFNLFWFHRERLVPWNLVARLLPVSLASGAVASWLAVGIDDHLLRSSIGVLLLLYGGVLLGWSPTRGEEMAASPRFHPRMWGWAATAGALAGFSGLGAGVLLSALMTRDRMFDLRRIAPTAQALMLANAMAAMPAFLLRGDGVSGVGFLHVESFLALAGGALLAGRWMIRRRWLLDRLVRARLIGGLLLLAGFGLVF